MEKANATVRVAHGVLTREQVMATLREVSPTFRADGWDFSLVAFENRMVWVRLVDTPSQTLVPWMLRRLEREMKVRLPELQGIGLLS